MSYKGILMMGVMMMQGMVSERKARKQRVLDEWQKTYSMPRKMKKKRRKELNIDWSIASWDPMGFDDMECLL